MGIFVKICGISNEEDLRATAALRPDALGFVFWAGSKRHVDPAAVGGWLRGAGVSGMLKAGVFVDAGVAEVARAVELAGLDVVQLHGGEAPVSYTRIGVRLWKVVHAGRTDPVEAAGWPVDAYLADTYSAEAPGGTGAAGDWSAARELVRALPRPVLLAGGLNPANVRQAIEAVRPWGVDVSSGVEARPGKKDLQKVREFIQKCREV